jgi:RNA polymerase sigma-70 factor (ECF subfamily)
MNITDIATALFQQYKEGDQRALEQLFHRTFPRLFDFAVKFTQDSAVSEDIVQEVFIKLVQNKSTIKSINIEAYLFRLVRNECIDYIKFVQVVKDKKVEFNSLQKIDELYRLDFVRDEPYLLIQEELKVEIEKTITSLPPRCKEVFILSRIEGLKNREIAEKLQISIKNVERHLAVATKKFKDKFADNVPVGVIILVIRTFF